MRHMDAFQMHAHFKTDRIGKQDSGEVCVQEGPHPLIVVPDPKMLDGPSRTTVGPK